jgi:ketosteroid isomerase-like protein
MKPIAVVALVLAALAAAGCPRSAGPVAAPTEPVAAPAELDAAVRGAVEQWRQAYEVRSMDALAKRYAHDPTVAIVQDGALDLGWVAIEPVLRARLAHATQIVVRIKDLQVAPLGPGAAVAVAAMSRESTTGATTVTENGVITLVLREDPDGWVIVSEHYSYRRP